MIVGLGVINTTGLTDSFACPSQVKYCADGTTAKQNETSCFYCADGSVASDTTPAKGPACYCFAAPCNCPGSAGGAEPSGTKQRSFADGIRMAFTHLPQALITGPVALAYSFGGDPSVSKSYALGVSVPFLTVAALAAYFIFKGKR